MAGTMGNGVCFCVAIALFAIVGNLGILEFNPASSEALLRTTRHMYGTE